jgi:hypothetical protein
MSSETESELDRKKGQHYEAFWTFIKHKRSDGNPPSPFKLNGRSLMMMSFISGVVPCILQRLENSSFEMFVFLEKAFKFWKKNLRCARQKK